jgi:catechol-2,3-dioxygenase
VQSDRPTVKDDTMDIERHIPKVAELGHIGIHCFDIDKQSDFYTRLLGLTITDQDSTNYFLSSRPGTEHHELVLTAGRDADPKHKMIQQVSFRCGKFEDVLGFYRRFKEAGTKIDMTVSHGNAVGVYFFDPEGNRIEVYWQTGLDAKQSLVEPINIEADPDILMDVIRDSVRRHATHANGSDITYGRSEART